MKCCILVKKSQVQITGRSLFFSEFIVNGKKRLFQCAIEIGYCCRLGLLFPGNLRCEL